MEATSNVQVVRELVRRLCIAMMNVEAFSADHPVAKKNIDGAFQSLQQLLQQRQAPIVLSVTGKQVMLDGLSLEDANPLVTKFAARLEEIHAGHLSFTPELTAEEFASFYRTLGKGPKVINDQGGLAPLLEQAGVTHIQTRQISYVMVDEDQKVVSRAAQVVEPAAGVPGGTNTDLARYVLDRMLEKTDAQQWLVQEMKNNPQRAADLFVEGINLAASRAEMGLTDAGSGRDGLLQSLQVISERLAQAESGANGAETVGIEQAVLTLENEVRRRSSTLMSSKVAAGLVNEVLAVIGGHTDRIRARKLSDEFIKGERSLQKAEALLRDLTPASESVDQFLGRIRQQLTQRGVTAEELQRITEAVAAPAAPAVTPPAPPARPAPAKSPAPRKRRKRYAANVADGVTRRLKQLQIEVAAPEQLIDSLSAYIEEQTRARAGELRLDVERLRGAVGRRDHALHQLPWGVVLWNNDGNIEFMNRAAESTLEPVAPTTLGTDALHILGTETFPLADGVTLQRPSLSSSEQALVRAVRLVLRDDAGQVMGAILAPTVAPAE